MTSYYNTKTAILRDEEEDRISRKKTDYWIFILLLIVVALVPLLIGGYVKDVVSPQITTIDIISSGLKGDIFTHYKLFFLVIITLLVASLLLSKVFFMNGLIRKSKLNIFIGIFIFAIILSTILSPTISISLWGQYNRSDGAISYICYIILFFVAMNIEYPQKALNYMMYALYPFIFINFILITMNFMGFDTMSYPIVQKAMSLFLPDGSSLGDDSILLGTLNQWNYMSGMFAIMTVMYLAWTIVDSNKIRSSINVLVSVISLTIMLMSISTSGFITVVVIIPLLIVLAIKSPNRKKAFIGLAAFLILGMSVFHMLAEKNPRVWNESIGFFIKKNPYVEEQPITFIPTDHNHLFGQRVFAADNKFELPTLPESGMAPGSGRFYIWEKTLKLTMNRPLYGFGLDTLAYHFPHYNIDARAGLGTENDIVDKPHSMYVGILYGTGIIGFIGFAGLAIITVISALKAVIKRKDAIVAVFGLAWIAFLIQAFFNDSLPGTAGPMWTLAGMMMAIIFTNNNIEIHDGRNE